MNWNPNLNGPFPFTRHHEIDSEQAKGIVLEVERAAHATEFSLTTTEREAIFETTRLIFQALDRRHVPYIALNKLYTILSAIHDSTAQFLVRRAR